MTEIKNVIEEVTTEFNNKFIKFNMDEKEKIIEWCNDHCNDAYLIQDTFIFFYDVEDASIFKLKFYN